MAALVRMRSGAQLVAAVRAGDQAAVKRLLAAGADPNTRDYAHYETPDVPPPVGAGSSSGQPPWSQERHRTALECAAGRTGNNIDIVKMLLDRGAKVDRSDDET